MILPLKKDITFETSERSSKRNWVRDLLIDDGFLLAEYEGYTILNEKVSLLLDRALFSGESKSWRINEIIEYLKFHFGQDVYSLKLSFSQHLSTPWYFIAYQTKQEHINVIDLTRELGKPVVGFSNFGGFIDWLGKYRSLVMTSSYQESGLPEFDRELRKLGHPWPGNLDCLLGYPNHTKLAIVEFQNTSRKTVANHCNNDWFLPRHNRKGDEQRWKVLDIIRLQANIPLVILVWSENEPVIKMKVVEEIVYSNDAKGRNPGLRYSYKKILNKEDFLKLMRFTYS